MICLPQSRLLILSFLVTLIFTFIPFPLHQSHLLHLWRLFYISSECYSTSSLFTYSSHLITSRHIYLPFHSVSSSSLSSSRPLASILHLRLVLLPYSLLRVLVSSLVYFSSIGATLLSLPNSNSHLLCLPASQLLVCGLSTFLTAIVSDVTFPESLPVMTRGKLSHSLILSIVLLFFFLSFSAAALGVLFLYTQTQGFQWHKKHNLLGDIS